MHESVQASCAHAAASYSWTTRKRWRSPAIRSQSGHCPDTRGRRCRHLDGVWFIMPGITTNSTLLTAPPDMRVSPYARLAVGRKNSIRVVCGTVGDHSAVLDWVSLFVGAGLVTLRSRQALVVENLLLRQENLLLRQQLAVALRARRLPSVRWHDRLFWVVARRLVPDWRRHLVLVQPETVLS